MTSLVIPLSNPFAQIKAAASGDLNALRALADHSVAMVMYSDVDPVRTLQEGLIFARLAAAAGDSGDLGRVLSMLARAASVCESRNPAAADDHYAEGIGLASLVADGEHDESAEIAASGLNDLADRATPEILESAKQYALRMTEAY